MVSVTQRVKQVKQPYGGYVSPKLMRKRYLGLDEPAPLDHKVENVQASIVGTAVDYLTRLANGAQPEDAFKISLWGAENLGGRTARRALKDIDGLAVGRVDVSAIAAACRLSSYDVAYRAGPQFFNPHANANPDPTTIHHIAAMVERSLAFVSEYGPLLVDGFTTLGGYTRTVTAGDGDFVTADTLWDFKVSVNPPTTAHTLQLVMYWLMARHSDWNWSPVWNWDHKIPEADWRQVWDLDEYLRMNKSWPDDLHGPTPTHVGLYNPRLHTVYRLEIESLPEDVISAIERDVIGYQ